MSHSKKPASLIVLVSTLLGVAVTACNGSHDAEAIGRAGRASIVPAMHDSMASVSQPDVVAKR